MSETPKVQPNPNGEQSPEKRDNPFVKAAQRLGEVAVYTWGVVTGRGSGKRAKNTSDTIAPEAPVKSGDTSPIANTMSKKQEEALKNLGVEVITTPEYPVYPKPSLPKSVTTPDGRQYPAEIEPPKPTPLDILINKRKDEARAAKYSSSVNPDVYTRVKGENVIDKDMFSTTIPNVDKPKKDDNPEGWLNANLKIARIRFSEASVAAESHFFGKKKRQAELEAAAKQLKQCKLEYMRLKFADKIEAAKQDPEKQAELAAEMAQAAFASMQETSRMTTDKYDDMLDDRGKFKKAAAKVGKWFNKGGKIAQWLKLGGAGFVVGTATGTFAGIAGWPITTAVGIVTKLGVAGATKQAVLEEHRGEDRIAADDRLETIDPSFEKDVANMKIDDVMKRAVNVSVDNLKDVSIGRRDALRKKVISSSGKYAVGFVLGGVVGSFINDWWANSAHATGVKGNADTPSQSGSNQIPQSDDKPLIDNPAAKTIGNSVNPDTPNFSSYDYPWNWAAEKFGDANAMDQLHNLADKAMADGHTVQWFNNPDGSVWMKVDGSSATAHVLDVLSRYV